MARDRVLMTNDEKYMTIAILLAEKGAGFVNPNPRVGAVVVKNNKIVGRGFHEFFGGPHAEVNALEMAGKDANGATLYVTLEPCNHQGKTHACTLLILQKGIKNVVVGIRDPNPEVTGNGIGFLEQNGVEVISGILESRIRKQNEIFLKYSTTKLPFCVLKSAVTLDGKTATVAGESRWISGEQSRAVVHSMRNEMAAVMVGANTVITDDPLLNVRTNKKNSRNPLKIIIDSTGRIPLSSKVLMNDPQLCIVATTVLAERNRNRELERMGAQVILCPEKDGHVDLGYLVTVLGAIGIDSLLIESGGTLAFAALEAKIVDKIVTFISPRIIGGITAPTMVGGKGVEKLADAVRLDNVTWKKVGEDVMVEGYVEKVMKNDKSYE